jgi:hypothetical protein
MPKLVGYLGFDGLALLELSPQVKENVTGLPSFLSVVAG